MLLVADVHGAFSALETVGRLDEPLLVLGDLVNLVDYRTNEGIVTDVVGLDLVSEIVALRGADRAVEAAELWKERTGGDDTRIRSAISARMVESYERMGVALRGSGAVVTHGNVDDPSVLRQHLPTDVEYIDGSVIDVEGRSVGIVGGGVARMGSRGEVSDDAMAEKLDTLGPVEILCTHVPPAIGMLAEDVIGGTSKGSQPILDYIDQHQPEYHFFGDVHQPRATRWLRGGTTCVNVGYFRATGRPYRHG